MYSISRRTRRHRLAACQPVPGVPRYPIRRGQPPSRVAFQVSSEPRHVTGIFYLAVPTQLDYSQSPSLVVAILSFSSERLQTPQKFRFCPRTPIKSSWTRGGAFAVQFAKDSVRGDDGETSSNRACEQQ